MKHWWKRRVTIGMIVRIIADILLINVALILALVVRYMWLVGVQEIAVSSQTIFQNYIKSYLNGSWLLTLISLVIFYFSGFYTYGRMYQGRYKVVIVTQAVSLSYLVFGFLTFLLWHIFSLPRSVLVIAWLLTLFLLLSARLWSTLWKMVVQAERHLLENQLDDGRMKRVLVIGGAGYIGSALLPKLLANDYHVRLLDLLLFGEEPIANVIDHPRLEVMQADFRDVEKVVEAMQGIDAVIHLGAIVGDPACALDEDLTIEVNLMATRMIAEVAKGCGVRRFVFASTCSVYGAGDEILDERSALNPVSLYARSKIASEQVLRKMADERFVPVILRFGTIYGLSGRTRFDLVINLLTAKAVVDGKITVFGGEQWRPFVHVDDAALAALTVLEASLSKVRDQVFNVGSNEQNFTIHRIGEMIHAAVPNAQLLNMGTDTDLRNYRVSFDKIRRELGFVPHWTIQKGIHQVITAIETNQVQDYRDSKYSNVKFLREEGGSRLIRTENGWAYELINGTANDQGDVVFANRVSVLPVS